MTAPATVTTPTGSLRRPGWRLGLTGRLVVLVLLPLVALSGVSTVVAVRMRTDAVRASAARASAGQVTRLVEALGSVTSEHADALTIAESVGSGFSVRQASVFLGTFVQIDLRRATTATDRALAALPAPLRARLVPLVAEARRLAALARPAVARMNGDYATVESALAGTARTMLDSLEVQAMSSLGDVTAGRSVLALRAALRLASAAASETQDEAHVWFTSTAASQAAARTLVGDVASFDEAGRELASSGVPAVVAAWRAYRDSPATAAYDALTGDGELALRMPFHDGHFDLSSGTVPVITLISAYRSVPTHWQVLDAVFVAASRSARTALAAVERTHERTFAFWLIALLLVVAGSLAVALAVARSIARPLRRLAQSADSVIDGNLDVQDVHPDGPPEAAVLADAFNALLANLRLLEAKTQALSSCDFDNEVLSTPLPGRLGAALQDSVHVLAGSIQDRDELQQRLAYEATHDTLTGLLNRSAATAMLEQAIARAARRVDTTAVLYVDLDNFKQANDVHGHGCGDHVLREVGARLTSASRSDEIVGRLGGDEFVVVAERVEGIEEATALADRLLAVLAERVDWNDVRLGVAASIGVAVCRGDELSAQELLARADLGLYQAKRQGGGAVAVYDEQLQARLARREEIERELHDELATGGHHLVLHFQPLVDADMALSEVEALLRWQRPGHGLVQPDGFIPIAEQSELIVQIDRWVLAHAAGQLRSWAGDPALAGVGVSVNISGRHLLGGHLPSYLASLLVETPFDPTLLTIEITETVLLSELTEAAVQLAEVRSLGVKVAIDDFGTGYTSLAHLHHLPIDSLKIDRTFISAIDTATDASLVQMITDLARNLGLVTVSEGVETEAQLEALQQLGSDRLQGYLIARPMPPDQLSGWLHEWTRAPDAVGAPPGR